MTGVFDFLVEPVGGRVNNSKVIDGNELLLNTELQNHSYVNRVGVVIATPKINDTNIQVGDQVILHHNVFRRFKDIRGIDKNSRSYYKEDQYFVSPDQIFGYKRNNGWLACKGFNFVKPIKETKMFSIDFEKPLVGVLKYKDEGLPFLEEGDLIGFNPGSEYEFIIDEQRLYRIPTNSITIKYEYKGDEEEYN